MSKWMCDVIGSNPTSACNVEKIAKEGITHESLEGFIGNRGNLPINVKDYIKKLGYTWSDSGGGCNSWHLGVPFDDLMEALNYLNKITTHFKKAIGAGLLRFKLMSWTNTDWK